MFECRQSESALLRLLPYPAFHKNNKAMEEGEAGFLTLPVGPEWDGRITEEPL